MTRHSTIPAAVLAVLAWTGAATAQVTLEGRLTDASGAPVADADIDFFEAANGRKLDLTGQNDTTDFAGFYLITVTPDIYDVRFEPPPGRNDLAPVFERDLILALPQRLDVVLPAGSRLTGRVLGPDGGAVANVDLDLIDSVAGSRGATVRDDTDSGGFFGLTVVPGIWDVTFAPPLGSGAGPLRINGVDVLSDAVLDAQLPRGFRVSGTVQQASGAGVFRADIDARDRGTRRSIRISNDATAFDGTFAVVLPEARMDIFVVPPPTAPLAPAAFWDVRLDTDRDLGAIVLTTGAVLTGTVVGPGGAPLAGTEVDLFRAGTCDKYPAPEGLTDAGGNFSLHVLPGDYDIQVQPAAGSTVPGHRFEAVSVTGDRFVALQITGTVQTVTLASFVRNEDGDPVVGARVAGEPLGGGSAWESATLPDGSFSAAVVPDAYRVTLEPPPGVALGTVRLESVDLPCGMPGAVTLPGVAAAPVLTAGVLSGHPNPWRSGTNIDLDLTAPLADAVVEVFDVAGRRVSTLHRGPLPIGPTRIPWDGTNDAGRSVSTGMYVVSLRGDGVRSATKVARILP